MPVLQKFNLPDKMTWHPDVIHILDGVSLQEENNYSLFGPKKQRRKNDPQSCNTGAATEKGNTVSTLLWNPRPVAVTKLQLPNFFDTCNW